MLQHASSFQHRNKQSSMFHIVLLVTTLFINACYDITYGRLGDHSSSLTNSSSSSLSSFCKEQGDSLSMNSQWSHGIWTREIVMGIQLPKPVQSCINFLHCQDEQVSLLEVAVVDSKFRSSARFGLAIEAKQSSAVPWRFNVHLALRSNQDMEVCDLH